MMKCMKKIIVLSLAAAMVLGNGAMISAAVPNELTSATQQEEEEKEFSVTSSISKQTINIGQWIGITADSKNGEGEVQYRFSYRRVNQKQWTVIRDYSTKNTASVKPKNIIDYIIKVEAKDEEGKVVEDAHVFTVYSMPTSTASISSDHITLGQTVTLNGGAEGGSGEYEYIYYFRKATDNGWRAVKRDYSNTESVTLKPYYAEDYEICIKSRDVQTQKVVKTYFKLSVADKLTIENRDNQYVAYGDTLRLQAQANGGSGDYRYAFFIKTSEHTNWFTLKGYSRTPYFDLDTKDYYGVYNLCIKAKDSNGAVAKTYYDINSCDAPTNISTVNGDSVDAEKPMEMYNIDTLWVELAAYGGIDPDQNYQFTVTATDKNDPDKVTTLWETTGNYQSKSIPMETGNYTITITAKDAVSGLTSILTQDVLVKKYQSTENTSTINKTRVQEGEPIVINASAEKGAPPYTYSYSYATIDQETYERGENQVIEGETSDTLSYSFDKEGLYAVRVAIKDQIGYTAYQTFYVTVDKKLSCKANIVGGQYVSQGNTVEIQALADGGDYNYQYAFEVKKDGESEWQTLRDYEDYFAIQFDTADRENGTYHVRALVKDTNGHSIADETTVIVCEGMTNDSTVTQKEIYEVDPITVNLSAKGGIKEDGEYTFKVWYEKQESPDDIYGNLLTTTENNVSKEVNLNGHNIVPGVYNICISATDSVGLSDTVKYAVTVKKYKNTSIINTQEVQLGDSVQIETSATGGVEPYTCSYEIKKPNADQFEVIEGENNNILEYTFWEAGEYQFRSVITDSEGRTASKDFTVTVSSRESSTWIR